MGKTVLSKLIQGQKLMKFIIKERMQYLYNNGYRFGYGIASNRKTRSATLGFGGAI
jgi:hypothetical protein